MIPDLISFGKIERFEVRFKWLEDDELVTCRPRDHGWSMAKLVLNVAGANLTAHRVGEHTRNGLVWYLGPLLHWLAENWVVLLHEEDFLWPERAEGAAAEVCNGAIARFAAVGTTMAESMNAAEAWYRRHGFSSAAAGGLFPDIFLRRFSDDAELSWTAEAPPFSPEKFTFETEAGFARMPVADVAEPLWKLLQWVKDNPPQLETPAFQKNWDALLQKIDSLDRLVPKDFNIAAMSEGLLSQVDKTLQAGGHDDLLMPKLDQGRHFAIAEAPAVAMFGGLSVTLADDDISKLSDALVDVAGGEITEPLSSLVENSPLRGKPWQDGYDLAESLLERLEGDSFDLMPEGYIRVRELCDYLAIKLDEQQLKTFTIRGVALAGVQFRPSILVNTQSAYNGNEDGRRFTIAHEICHILHDQSRARQLAHVSGPWAAPGIEKRANAFAAWLIMPPRLLQQHMEAGSEISAQQLRKMASAMHVADSALSEHLFNLDLIDETNREALRQDLRH